MKRYKSVIILIGIVIIISIIISVLYYRKMQVDSLIKPNSVFPLRLSWEIDMGQLAYDRPIYQNGMVFSTADGLVFSKWYAVKANTGELEWVHPINRGNFFQCLTTEYLVLSGPWSLATIHIYNRSIWITRQPPADTATCNEKMVFSSGHPRDSILTYELKSGQMIHYGTNSDKSFHGLIYNDDKEEIIAASGYEFYIIDPQTSVLKHSFKELAAFSPNDNSPYRGPMYLVDNGELFIGGTVQDAQTGQIIHKEDNFETDYLPTVTTDSMYLSTRSDGIVSFDRDDYSVKWIYQPQPSNPLAPLGPIAILEEIGYAIFSDATVRAFDLETGQEVGYWQPDVYDLWFWPICTFPPGFCSSWARAGLASSEDMLFVSFGDGKLYAFGK